MLTPEYLDTLPDAATSLWQRVEDAILREIGRRIALLGELDPLPTAARWQLWRFAQSQTLRQDIVRLLARYSGRSDAVIRRLLQEGCSEALRLDDALYRAVGFAPASVDATPALLNLLNAGYRQTLGSWHNLTATTARTVSGRFEAALDEAWLGVSSVAFSYDAVIRRTVAGLAEHMPGVTYPSGRKDTLEVAVRRCVLTGVNQTAAKLQLERAKEMGCSFVEVSAHAGARSDGSRGPSDHAFWQGKVYSLGGLAGDAAHTADGEPDSGNGQKKQGQAGDTRQIKAAVETRYRAGWQDVTEEYLQKATPGSGSITMDEGYRTGGHVQEIKTARWLLEHLGGDVRLLKEATELFEKRPDYLWNERSWELKNISSTKAVDSALRGALQQIANKTGGVILNCGNNDLDLSKILDAISYRVLRSGKSDADIMILIKETLAKIVRYKKE